MFIFLLEKWPLFQEEPGTLMSFSSELSRALFRRQFIFLIYYHCVRCLAVVWGC